MSAEDHKQGSHTSREIWPRMPLVGIECLETGLQVSYEVRLATRQGELEQL